MKTLHMSVEKLALWIICNFLSYIQISSNQNNIKLCLKVYMSLQINNHLEILHFKLVQLHDLNHSA